MIVAVGGCDRPGLGEVHVPMYQPLCESIVGWSLISMELRVIGSEGFYVNSGNWTSLVIG